MVVEFAVKTNVGLPLACFVVILMGCVHVVLCMISICVGFGLGQVLVGWMG